MASETTNVIAGIDTHSDTHHVAVINEYGKPLADREFLAVGSGYRKIVDFITSYGTVTAVGVEGTGSYGAELARTLSGEGLTSAVKARTAAINQIKGLLVSAPDKLRAKYRGLGTSAMITALQRTRPTGHMADTEYVCLMTLKALATRCHSLAAEIATAGAALQEILDTYAPMICDLPGVGTEVASQLLVTVGDNTDRLGNEAQFAALVGVAPTPASSGKTTRHRLSRGGDRNANHALYQVVLVRMASCQRTKDYVAKRTAEGKSKREIIRKMRTRLGCTITTAGRELGQRPSKISLLERGLLRNDILATTYRQWLTEQLWVA